MSEGAPTQRLPRQIEPRKLAYNQVSFNGIVQSKNLQRLTDTAQINGDIEVNLDFHVDEQGRRIVSGQVKAAVALECQRCLQLIDEQILAPNVMIAVVKNEDESKQLPKHIDPWIVEEDEADFYAFIEDELLLTMPVAAYHDYSCIDESLLSRGDGEEREQKPNPFSVLADMKNQK